MKRSKYVQLSLAAAVSATIAGCGSQEPTVIASKQFSFQTVKECATASIPVDICSDAYINAMAEHRRLAPAYPSAADCEADFVEDYCEVDSRGQYLPRLGGFQLTASGPVTQAQLDQANAMGGASSSGGNHFLTGLLIGNLLGGNGGRYYSEPVYRYRDSRGSFATSTLGRRIESGATFKKAYSVNNQPYASSVAKRVSTQAVSRGGFGSQSAARSGWGGGSRSFGG